MVGVLTIAAGTAGIVDPAGYVPVPFLLGLVWVLVDERRAGRPRRPAGDAYRPGRAAEAVPAGAVGTA